MRVAIVGGSDTWVDAPFNDPEWKIWVLGNQIDNYKNKRIDRIFEIHNLKTIRNLGQKYPEYLVGMGVPLVVSDEFPLKAPHVHVFDYDAALPLIGENFSSSIAVCMAQAIMDGAEEIAIYGVNMAVDDHEYSRQRAAMEQWIGYAKGLGIKVRIPDSSPLGKSSYRESSDWNGMGKEALLPFTESQFLAVADVHKAKMEEIEGQIRGLQQAYAGHDGARQAYERLAKVGRAVERGDKIVSLTNEIKTNG